jgi:hypothetical protein
MNLGVLAARLDLPHWTPRRKRWSAAISVAALCGAAASVGLLDTTPEAIAVPAPMPASIEPIPTTQSSDTLLLPYFETNLDEPPPAAPPPPTQEPPAKGIPFLPPLPTLQIPTFFPFPPPGE